MQNPVVDKLSVMLIDETSERSQSLREILNTVGCEVIACVPVEKDLLQQIDQYKPDIVIIDTELPDRDMMENLRNVQSTSPKPMVMFSQDDDGFTIRRAIQAGVSAYVVDGIHANRVRPILDAAIATFDQYQVLQRQLDVTRYQLDKQKKLERAKNILMKQRGINEDQAYQAIRKTAMDQKRKMEDIAQSIIQAAELLGGNL